MGEWRRRIHLPPRAVLAALVALALYHVSLLGKGALAWPDEHLYEDSLGALRALGRGDVPGFCHALTGWGARPGEAVVRLLPAAAQLAAERLWGWPPLGPRSLRIPASVNVVTSFLLALAFHAVARRFVGPALAGLATVLFALLTSSQVYVRHLSPYDTSLLLAFVSLALAQGAALVEPSGRHADRRLALAGLAGGCGLAVYPAYYPFPVVVAAYLLFSADPRSVFRFSRASIRRAALFCVAAGSVLLAFEVVARIGHRSYLGSARRLSRTITLGSFEEGFVYLPRYLLEVEGAAGALLLALAGTWLVLALAKGLDRRGKSLARASAIFLALYLVYGAQSAWLHDMAFTGRYVRMYVPALLCCAVAALRHVPPGTARRVVTAALLGTFAITFGLFARDYARLAYPIDVLFAAGIGLEDVVPENRVDETEMIPGFNSPRKELTAGTHLVTLPGDHRYVLVNLGVFTQEGGLRGRYRPPAGAQRIFSAPHFMTFRSSLFEAYPIARRLDLAEHEYAVEVYRLRDVP